MLIQTWGMKRTRAAATISNMPQEGWTLLTGRAGDASEARLVAFWVRPPPVVTFATDLRMKGSVVEAAFDLDPFAVGHVAGDGDPAHLDRNGLKPSAAPVVPLEAGVYDLGCGEATVHLVRCFKLATVPTALARPRRGRLVAEVPGTAYSVYLRGSTRGDVARLQ